MIDVDKIYHADCLDILPKIEDGVIDCILTDPPFLYLKNQKLERKFDEEIFFRECKRVISDNGFLCFFGRGSSFYRWNVICENLGLIFKEEVIWDKGRITGAGNPIGRSHETVAIYTKKDGKIRRSHIPYLEYKGDDMQSIIADIKRMKSVFVNAKELQEVEEYLKSGQKTFSDSFTVKRFNTSMRDIRESSRCVNVVAMMREGCQERDIIREVKNSYQAIHPTEKPVRLLQRILSLVVDEGGIVLDPFCGSGSTCVAARNLFCHYIGVEIDEEYFTGAKNRLDASLF